MPEGKYTPGPFANPYAPGPDDEPVTSVAAALQRSDDEYGAARNGDYWLDMARAAIEAYKRASAAAP